jgi:hypothetical protein
MVEGCGRFGGCGGVEFKGVITLVGQRKVCDTEFNLFQNS